MSFVQIKSLWEKKNKINLLLVTLEELKYKYNYINIALAALQIKVRITLRRKVTFDENPTLDCS